MPLFSDTQTGSPLRSELLPLTLDYIKPIRLNPVNRLRIPSAPLHYLPYGLGELAKEVRTHERRLCEKHGAELQIITTFGSHPLEREIACLFHWFSVSAVNYVRSVAFMAYMNESDFAINALSRAEVQREVKLQCNAYLLEVIPEIKTWRDKVSAHFCATDPRSDDTLPSLAQSLHNTISFNHGRFETDTFRIVINGEESTLPKWSLTRVYEEELVPRFWPENLFLDQNPREVAQSEGV